MTEQQRRMEFADKYGRHANFGNEETNGVFALLLVFYSALMAFYYR